MNPKPEIRPDEEMNSLFSQLMTAEDKIEKEKLVLENVVYKQRDSVVFIS